MKNIISQRATRGLMILPALVGFSLAQAADTESAGGVNSPAKRQEVIDQATKLLAHREMAAVIANPFQPEGFDEIMAASGRPPGTTASTPTTAPGDAAPPQQPTGPRSERDLLNSIGAGLKPSGFFVLGGSPTLVFGQKRVKAGGSLTITFEGVEYTLVVTSIAPPNFTLRLNREEFTRTIK